MSSIELAIENAYESNGARKDANKVHLEFLKSEFLVPIEKGTIKDPSVLYLEHERLKFMPIFSSDAHLNTWAQDILTEIDVMKIKAPELLKGVGDNVYLALNIGSKTYKEFATDEIAKLKSIVLKLFSK